MGQAAGEKTPILADARRMTGMFSRVDGFSVKQRNLMPGYSSRVASQNEVRPMP